MNRVSAEGRTAGHFGNGFFFERCGKRTGIQNGRQRVGVFFRKAAGNLTATADFGVDSRRGIHFAVENDAQVSITVLLNVGRVLFGKLAESVCAVCVKAEVDAVSAVLVDSRRGVGKEVAGNVVNIFDAQDFSDFFIANSASSCYIIFVIEVVFLTRGDWNPHANFVERVFIFSVNAGFNSD